MSQAQWWGSREDREILRGFGREIITVKIIAQSTLYAVQFLMDTVYNAIERRTVYDVQCMPYDA